MNHLWQVGATLFYRYIWWEFRCITCNIRDAKIGFIYRFNLLNSKYVKKYVYRNGSKCVNPLLNNGLWGVFNTIVIGGWDYIAKQAIRGLADHGSEGLNYSLSRSRTSKCWIVGVPHFHLAVLGTSAWSSSPCLFAANCEYHDISWPISVFRCWILQLPATVHITYINKGTQIHGGVNLPRSRISAFCHGHNPAAWACLLENGIHRENELWSSPIYKG